MTAMKYSFSVYLCLVTALLLGAFPGETRAVDELPSWNEGLAKSAIIDFVTRVTDEQGTGFVPVRDRIAVFDNDGTLWSEQPMYFQAYFVLDRLKRAPQQNQDRKWDLSVFAALKGDFAKALAGGEKGLVNMVTAAHAGMTTEEFEAAVKEWIATARHPQTGRLFTQMVYQPMLELLQYLRANGFKTYIVSGGGIEFLRPWAEQVYGVPPEQVIGSSVKTKFELRDEKPVLVRLAELNVINDKAEKPVSINSFIGRRPIAAFGNSDGDFEMLQWVTTGPGPRFGLIVHHTDGAREFAYDRNSAFGRLDKGLDEAETRGWTVVDMKSEWKTIYPDIE
ncbi:HAD family hydrolase [Schlesneria sp. DSM 10557]|uniref:HAD family hydrolase n=1 Tax=Schlesneria sp. DSM 10557 TaxID=3044399 RepID=UPI0035A13373